MQQINEDTGTSRPVQRLCTPSSASKSTVAESSQPGSRPSSANRDARVACLREERGLAVAFIRQVFSRTFFVSYCFQLCFADRYFPCYTKFTLRVLVRQFVINASRPSSEWSITPVRNC